MATEGDIRFDVPLYTLVEAADALGVPVSTFVRWARGYTVRVQGHRPVRQAPIVTALPVDRKKPAVPFVGLVEGLVLAAVREAGVPLQRVRPALEVISKTIGIHHALASRRLFTDGAELLYGLSEPGIDKSVVRQLVVIRNGQLLFGDVVNEYLKLITYGADGYAEVIRLPVYKRAEVVVDPKRAFGQPIFRRGGVRVRDVLERFWAGEDPSELADDFGVPVDEIMDVVRAASRRAA